MAEGTVGANGLRRVDVRSTATPVPSSLYHPQQQAYSLLACTGSRPVAREYRGPLFDVARASPHRRGVTPVGALGTPIRRFWDISLNLLDDDRESGLAGVMNHLLAMSRTYGDNMELAMANEYLWSHAAAPVEPGDIDIVGITAMITRQFGVQAVRNSLEDRWEQLTPLARTPFELGMEIAQPESGPAGSAPTQERRR